MMIIGKKDAILNANDLSNQAKSTHTELVVFTGGHLSYIENRKELIKAIIYFIEKK